MCKPFKIRWIFYKTFKEFSSRQISLVASTYHSSTVYEAIFLILNFLNFSLHLFSNSQLFISFLLASFSIFKFPSFFLGATVANWLILAKFGPGRILNPRLLIFFSKMHAHMTIKFCRKCYLEDFADLVDDQPNLANVPFLELHK